MYDLSKYRSENARRNDRQQRIAEFIAHRKMHLSMTLILRLETPAGIEVAHGAIKRLDADAAAEQVSCCSIGIADFKCEKPNRHA